MSDGGPPSQSAGSAKLCTRCGARYDAAATFCQRDGARLVEEGLERDPYIGRVLLDQFRIEELIGAGGMGTVYRARQTTLERDVAIKILHHDLVQDAEAVRRFQREARVATALDHPNVVRVLLLGQLPDGSLYLVMEHLAGQSLGALVATRGMLEPARALHIGAQVCDGVGEAHAHGVVHRDVKPENVLVMPRGQDPDFVKVLDFGVARLLRDEQTVLTRAGVIFGTARYISPEGAYGDPTDVRSDVYSIGVLLYQLLSGHTPFDGQTPVALLMKHIHTAPPPLEQDAQGMPLPQPLTDVVMRALEKDPDARPRDANELGRQLREAAEASGFARPEPKAGGAASSFPPPSPPAGGSFAPPRPGPAAGGRDTPTPVVGRAARSDPAAEQTGRPRASLGLVLTVVGAFLLGAGGVTAGAWLFGRLPGATTQAQQPTSARLEARARAALERGDLDRPPGDNVADLTARIFEREPEHAGAKALRRKAAERLRARARRAKQQGERTEARRLYRRALALQPQNEAIERALAKLSSDDEQGKAEPGVRIAPETPTVGQQVELVAVVAPGTEIPNSTQPRFRLHRGGAHRTVPAARGDKERTWRGEYAFPRPGRYVVEFLTAHGEGGTSLRREVTVRARSRRRTAARPESPPATTERPARGNGVAVEASDDGIEWENLSPAVRSEDAGAGGSASNDPSHEDPTAEPPVGDPGPSEPDSDGQDGGALPEGFQPAPDAPAPADPPDPPSGDDGSRDDDPPPEPWTGEGNLL